MRTRFNSNFHIAAHNFTTCFHVVSYLRAWLLRSNCLGKLHVTLPCAELYTHSNSILRQIAANNARWIPAS